MLTWGSMIHFEEKKLINWIDLTIQPLAKNQLSTYYRSKYVYDGSAYDNGTLLLRLLHWKHCYTILLPQSVHSKTWSWKFMNHEYSIQKYRWKILSPALIQMKTHLKMISFVQKWQPWGYSLLNLWRTLKPKRLQLWLRFLTWKM